jgi:murein DD-endopeptidase MepM/ murein hydrolase activator NlpD
MYYYAHLQGYAPGLHEGQQVKQGQLIARVDHTGDAVASAPHLHFAINRMQPGQRWWQGEPINPYPLLAGKKANG